MTIVGVANDAQTSGPTAESTAPMLYTPATETDVYPRVLVRTNGGAASLGAATAMLTQMDIATRPPPAVSVAEMMFRSIAAPRFVMLLLSVFTTLALVLAAVGLYGVMAYTVAQHTREIGIRVALGASGERIVRSVIGRGAALATVGAMIGLGAAVWGTKLIENQLYGLARLDAPSFAIGALVLISAAIAACIVPTRRALAVDPMTAIRAD